MYHPCLLFHVGSRSLILIRIHPIPSFPDEREAALFHLQYLPIFLPSFHLNICAMMQSNTEMCYVPRAHSFLCFPRLCLESTPGDILIVARFKESKTQPQRDGMFAGARGLASDQIRSVTVDQRSDRPHRKRQSKRRKSEKRKTCKLVQSLILPFFPHAN